MNNSSNSPSFKTFTDPKTGRTETVVDTTNSEDAKAKLERTRRELREVLHGTGQIEVPGEGVPVITPATDADWEDFCDE